MWVRKSWKRRRGALSCAAALSLVAISLTGCGSTRSTNTMRSATEQLLISDAIDRAVQQINFTPLAGQSVYFEEKRLNGVVDHGYLASSLRQHLLASGCVLKANRDDADYIVEPRAGAIGTDNHDLLFGVPATNVPQVAVTAALPAVIPEIPIAKRHNQRGIAKLAVFAYHRETGEPAWQSGIVANESTANDIWLFGAGPFNRGTIYEGTRLAGNPIVNDGDEDDSGAPPQVAELHDAAVFPRGIKPFATADGGVLQASANLPVNPSRPPASEPPQVNASHDAQPATRIPSGRPPVLPPRSAGMMGM